MTIDTATTSWGSGRAIPGTPFRVLVPTASTDGRMVAIAAEMPPGLEVDEHTHDGEDQITIVISGTVGVSLGDERHRLTEGAVLFMPRGVPHSQWNDGSGPARVIEIYTPGGFEKVFEAAGRNAPVGRSAGDEEYAAARRDGR